MFIKVHLSGIAIAYEPPQRNSIPSGNPGRAQGSLYSQQKRAIADAVEWMRRFGKNKPVIFVATSPGFVDYRHERGPIKALTHYLRRSCDCQDYVWVREFTGHGYPHFHFVADMPVPRGRDDFRDFAVDMSRYWSSLFNRTAQNSVRFGTKPPRPRYFITDVRMARYLSKYIGKAISEDERRNGTVRRFQISQRARAESQPLTYAPVRNLFNSEVTYTADVLDPDGIPRSRTIDPHSFDWKRSKFHEVYFGLPNSGHKKT